MKDFDNFVNGKFVPSSGTARIVVKNPSTSEAICSVPNSTQKDVDDALATAVKAQRSWAKQTAIVRATLLKSIAGKIRENLEPLARAITEEQGKTSWPLSG